jgi:7tm Odorant receptor
MSETLKRLLSVSLFCDFVTSGVVLSLCAFEMFVTEDYFSVKFAARLQFANQSVLGIFIACRASENIKTESQNIATKIYESQWFELKENKKKIRPLIVNCVARTMKPIAFSALGFSNISYEAFITVRTFNGNY